MTSETDDVTNLGAIHDATARAAPSRVAVVDGTSGTSISYGAFATRVTRVAAVLESLGVDSRDRVALCYPNGVEYIVAMLAVARVGAVAVPVNLELSREMVTDVLDDCGARLVLVENNGTAGGGLKAALTDVNSVDTVAVHDGDASLSLDRTTVIGFDDIPVQTNAHTPASVSASNPALQPYTSGSTGRPKGVVLTHGGIEWCTTAFVEHLDLRATDRGLVVTPLYHKNATTGVVKPMLACGGSVVLLEQFDAVAALEAIATHDVTYMTGVPAVYKRLVAEREAHETTADSSLTWASCGSATVPDSLVADFRRAFDAELLEVYGLTEGGPVVTHSPRHGPRRIGSAGVPLPGVETVVVDPETDERRRVGESGELLVSNPGLGTYYERPDANDDRFVRRDGTRYLRTGDRVRVDEDGYHYVVGRIDDMMIVGGSNVYPADVENRLLGHDAVGDVAVVSVPHSEKGEAPVAFVVRDGPVTADELQSYALDHGPAFAYPRRVYFESRLALSGTGKVDQRTLRERALDDVGGEL